MSTVELSRDLPAELPSRLPARAGRPVLPRRAAFWVTAALAVLLPAASAVPTPLYAVYQQRFRLPVAALTVVFAAYCLAVLASMLLFGSLSDRIGRRPVLLGAVALTALAMLLFWRAGGLGGLLAARLAQGAGAGLGGCAVGAAVLDLAPARSRALGTLVAGLAPIAGLGAGALGAGLLVQYAPAPTALTYLAILAILTASAAALPFLPETVHLPTQGAAHGTNLEPGGGRSGLHGGRVGYRVGGGGRGRATWWVVAPRRISVPRAVRVRFGVLAVSIVAVWAVAGLYLSLGPELAGQLMHGGGPVVGGVVVAVLTGCGVVGELSLRWFGGVDGRRGIAVGAVAQVVGLGLVVLALPVGSTGLFLAGTAVLGVGWGATYLAAFRLVAALAEPRRCAELLAAVNVVAYLGTGLPTIAVGVAVGAVGLTTATALFAAAVAALLVASVATLPLIGGRR